GEGLRGSHPRGGCPAGARCQQRLDAPAAPPRDAAVLPPGGNDRGADRLFRGKIPPTAGQRRRVRSSSAHRVRLRHVGIHRPPSRRGLDRLGARAPPRNPSTPTRRVHPGERRRRATAIPGGDPARLRTDGAIVAALLCLALGARLVPLTFSPLPFSIDGFALARISSNIAADGTWRIDPADTNSYNQKLPGFSILWSAAAQVGGLSPLVHVQLILPFLTCTTVLVAYLLGVKAAGRRLGGFVAGLFIALFGSFLLLTSATAKESIGLLVFPVAVLLFREREDPRKRALAVFLLLFLPFLHSLTTFLTLGMLAALVVLRQRRELHRGRFSARSFALDIVTGPGLAVPAWAYYVSVDLPFLSEVLAPASFTLFLGIVTMLTAGLATMARPVPRRVGHRFASPLTRVVIPPAIGLLVILGNLGNGLFVGAVGIQAGLIQVLPAILTIAA